MDKIKIKFTALSIVLSLFTFTAIAQNEQAESDAGRIAMLERALAPTTAEAIAELYAKANKERNAAVQVMLVADSLKKNYKDFAPNWVSGTSSPWISSYEIKPGQTKNNQQQFVITYHLATSSGPFDPPMVETIVVEPAPSSSTQKFWISQTTQN